MRCIVTRESALTTAAGRFAPSAVPFCAGLHAASVATAAISSSAALDARVGGTDARGDGTDARMGWDELSQAIAATVQGARPVLGAGARTARWVVIAGAASAEELARAIHPQ